jgi:chaperonin cofactor prefoldin
MAEQQREPMQEWIQALNERDGMLAQMQAALEKEIKVCDDTDEYAKGLEAALREIDDWLHDHGYVDDDDPVRRIIRTALGDIEKTSSVAELRDNYLKRGIDTKPYESTFSEKRIE